MGSEGGSNGALRALLDEAGVSNAALARAVVAVGAEEGVHVGTNTTSVRRMLAGCQPRWPVPRLVATVLSRRLHYEVSRLEPSRRLAVAREDSVNLRVSVTDCGFVDRAAASEDLHDDLHCSGTLDGTLRTVVELSGRDMRRFKFLLGSASARRAWPSLRCSP